MVGITEGKNSLLGPAFLLITPRPAKDHIVLAAVQHLPERLCFHDVGVDLAAMNKGRNPLHHPGVIGMSDQLQPQPGHRGVAKGDHLAKLPGGIHMH